MKVDSVAGVGGAGERRASGAPNVQAPRVAGRRRRREAGTQVVRKQSSTTETSVMNSSRAGSTTQAALFVLLSRISVASRLVRTVGLNRGLLDAAQERGLRRGREPTRRGASAAATRGRIRFFFTESPFRNCHYSDWCSGEEIRDKARYNLSLLGVCVIPA